MGGWVNDSTQDCFHTKDTHPLAYLNGGLVLNPPCRQRRKGERKVACGQGLVGVFSFFVDYVGAADHERRLGEGELAWVEWVGGWVGGWRMGSRAEIPFASSLIHSIIHSSPSLSPPTLLPFNTFSTKVASVVFSVSTSKSIPLRLHTKQAGLAGWRDVGWRKRRFRPA